MSIEGTQLGHYRLLRQIGEGGMGEIYLAEDTHIARQVAVKMVHNKMADSRDASETQKEKKAYEESIRLFRREMKAIASLDNPHILTLLDFGEGTINQTAIIYMVMPYRPEGSLDNWMRQRKEKLSLEEISNIIQQAADALQHAHDNGIIHQDVKPANFLIRSKKDKPNQPDLLLADFGIAKLLSTTSTISQTVRGTPTFMPPEQWDGNPVPATDQYALAIMAYLLLTGRTPFQGRPEQVMRQHFMNEPIAPSKLNSQLSPAIDAVLLHALEKKPEERFVSISNFSNAFQQALQYAKQSSAQEEPILPPPPNEQRRNSFEQLWAAAMQAKARGDSERCFHLLIEIITRVKNLTPSQRESVASVIQSLRQLIPLFLQKARKASTLGDWQNEILFWKRLVILSPSPQEMSEQITLSPMDSSEGTIQERLNIAQQNEEYAWMYTQAQQFINKQDNAAARTQLETLWEKASFYGDPEGLASRIMGLSSADNYEQALAKKLKLEQEQAAKKLKA